MLYSVFVFVYLLVLIAVGAIKARKIKSQEDFSLAGRKLGTFVLIGTLLATWIGTGSIFGNTEETYRVGIPAFVIPISGTFGIIALYFLAAKIRSIRQFTIQDILEQRYGALARVLGTVTLVLAYVIIVSYQYRAGAAVMVRLLPSISQSNAIVMVAAFVILYTALAGMFSVAYTDVVNGLLMCLGIGMAIALLYPKVGGMEGILTSLPNDRASFNITTRGVGPYSYGHLISILMPSFLLLLGDANMYGRFFSAKSPKEAKTSALGMLLGVVTLECAIIFLALIGLTMVYQGALTPPSNSAHIIVHLAFEALPPIIGAGLVATVVAVVVSTADSYLLAPSTAVVRDIYQRFIDRNASETKLVVVSRVAVLFLGLSALALAFTSDKFFNVSLFAYTIYGAGITPALVCAFVWNRVTSLAAVASTIVGIVTAIVWKFVIVNTELADQVGTMGMSELKNLVHTVASWKIDAVIPALTLNIITLVLVTLLSKERNRKRS